ncbi:S1 family peptidase [Actinoalloteichus spitiensis]|uniref:S1 family peptidase n=1 Tax=Actinoalloteichus spitiensis TaxID=252394 RepID=UPI00037859CC|nr:trypsin-like serine protease [Actinoalloteichus spitiensis]
MRSLRLLAVAACVALGGLVVPPAAAADTAGSASTAAPQPMIIDGHRAEEDRGTARLLRDGTGVCTATIIAPEWALTTKWCVTPEGQYSLRYGALEEDGGSVVEQAPNGVVAHPSAGIALVRLDSPVQADFARLARTQQVVPGDHVQGYGWGRFCVAAPGNQADCETTYLRYTELRVSAVGLVFQCGGVTRQNHVCVTRIDGIPAGGDSGGPLFSESGYQIGVSSTSDSMFASYVHVPAFYDWISEVTGI